MFLLLCFGVFAGLFAPRFCLLFACRFPGVCYSAYCGCFGVVVGGVLVCGLVPLSDLWFCGVFGASLFCCFVFLGSCLGWVCGWLL